MTNVFPAPEGPKTVQAESVILNTAELPDDGMLVDLNRIVQESLIGINNSVEKQNAIIRCDNLPHIYAAAQDLRQLSERLIHLILHHPPRESKLFIYIKCNRTENESLSTNTSGRLNSFDVYFYTNSCNDVSWQAAHQKELNECRAICARYSGSFVAAHGHADFLFKLTLPGKLF